MREKGNMTAQSQPGCAASPASADAEPSAAGETCFTCQGEGRIHDLDALPGMFWAADMTMQCPICEGSGIEPETQP